MPAALLLSVRLFLLGPFLGEVSHKLRTFVLATLLTLAISLVANLVFMLRRILGQKTFYNLVTGRYHAPVEEERLIMFLDVASSTTIAEKIGHKRFHAFLNMLFHEITEPVLSAGGEIYKYVGDEVIVTWRGYSAAENLRCVKSYFDIVDELHEHREEYLRRFDFVPHLRAGMHRGTVTVGELGDFKREIALIGDTMNTTARIQEACKHYRQDLVVSSELMRELPSPLPYHIEILGKIQLRGKEKSVELYGVKRLQGRR